MKKTLMTHIEELKSEIKETDENYHKNLSIEEIKSEIEEKGVDEAWNYYIYNFYSLDPSIEKLEIFHYYGKSFDYTHDLINNIIQNFSWKSEKNNFLCEIVIYLIDNFQQDLTKITSFSGTNEIMKIFIDREIVYNNMLINMCNYTINYELIEKALQLAEKQGLLTEKSITEILITAIYNENEKSEEFIFSLGIKPSISCIIENIDMYARSATMFCATYDYLQIIEKLRIGFNLDREEILQIIEKCASVLNMTKVIIYLASIDITLEELIDLSKRILDYNKKKNQLFFGDN